MPFHRETRRVANVQLTLREAQDLLELMKRGVKRVNGSITAYVGSNSVEVANAADLARDTLIGSEARQFTIEVKAGEPYTEKVFVNCRSSGRVVIEAGGVSEEWVLGKVNIVARYLGFRQRRITLWLRRFRSFWLVCFALAVVEALSFWSVGRPVPKHALASLMTSRSAGGVCGVFIATLAAGRTLGTSLLEVHIVPVFRSSLARDLILPLSVGILANGIFYILTKIA